MRDKTFRLEVTTAAVIASRTNQWDPKSGDDPDDAEDDVRHLVDEREQRPAALAQRVQREGEQDGEQQHLEDVALGEGADEGVRNDVQQRADQGLLLGLGGVGGDRLGVERGGVDVHAGPGPPDVDDDEADDQGHGRHHLEVEQGLEADAADLLHVLHAGDAVDDGAEDDRRDQHLDQRHERVAERLQLLAGLRGEVADQDADRDRAEHLDVEVPVPGPVVHRGGRYGRGGRHRRSPP